MTLGNLLKKDKLCPPYLEPALIGYISTVTNPTSRPMFTLTATMIHSCKFWRDPVALARNLGFSAKELRDIEKIIVENQPHLLEAWYEYPGH
jgi:hypothetical protein